MNTFVQEKAFSKPEGSVIILELGLKRRKTYDDMGVKYL